MIKRPFLSFILIMAVLVSGILWFFESPRFAGFAKTVLARYVPKDFGIEGDFSELSIQLFPPGLAIKKPTIEVGKHNILHLPAGASVRADSLVLSFRPFQIFSGKILVHSVTIKDGKVYLPFEASEGAVTSPKRSLNPSGKGLNFHWDELLQIRAESIALENVEFEVGIASPGKSKGDFVEGNASFVELSQWSGKGGLGYSVKLDIQRVQGSLLAKWKLPQIFRKIRGRLFANALGIQLEEFLIETPGLQVGAHGQANGNFLKTKGLLADVHLDLKGNLKEFLEFNPNLGLLKPTEAPTGEIQFKGRVQGNLEKPLETIQAEGEIRAQNIFFKGLKFDKVFASAQWDSAPGGGKVVLQKAIFDSALIPRKGGSQPGSGGRIEIGPVQWSIGARNPIHAGIKFEHAHLHWLGAPILKSVYPLDFRLNGEMKVTFNPPSHEGAKDWEVQGVLDNWVENFQLDNQKYRVEKPLRTLFKVPRIDLKGPWVFNPSGFAPNNVAVIMPHTKLITSGRIDSKTGYGLHAHGNIDFKDLGTVAENEIKGSGQVAVHVHGLSARTFVDIDVDVKDAYYLNLFLGGIVGRVTWDDDPSKLIFTQVNINKGVTHCVANGLLDLNADDRVALKVDVNNGNIQDLIQIFGNLTQPLWWFPHDLNGAVKGPILLSGGIGLDRLEIASKLKGSNWEVWGEHFKDVQFSGGYDKGKYYLRDLDVVKKVGSVGGKIEFSRDGQFEWDLYTENLKLTDFDHIAHLDVPIRGELEGVSEGSGTEGRLNSNTTVTLDKVLVRGIQMAPSRFQVGTKDGISKLQMAIMGGQGVVDGSYDPRPTGKSYLRSELKQFDFSPILLLFNSQSMRDRQLAGLISTVLNLEFNSNQLEKANGFFNLTEFNMIRSDTSFQIEHPVSAKINNGNFEISDLALEGKTGQARLNLVGMNSRLDGSIFGELDNSFVEFFVSSIAQASGASKLDFNIGGTYTEPTLYGHIDLNDSSVRVSSLDAPFENITGTIELKQNIITVQNIDSDVGGGRIKVNGKVVVNADRLPDVNLKANLNNAKLKVYPFQYAKMNGSIFVHGKSLPYDVDGNLTILSALSKEKMLNQKSSSAGLKVAQYAPHPSKAGEMNYPKFRLKIDIEAPDGVVIQNDLFRDVQAKGSLSLINTIETPRVLGIVEITQGKLLFKDHVFLIQSAAANFDNPTLIYPTFDLNANTELNGFKIHMYASGRAPDKIKVELSSNPPLQDTEILSLLATGFTSIDARKLNASDRSIVQQGEAASLVLHSLDFNRELEEKTGFQVQLDETVNSQQGISAFRPPQTQGGDNSAAPQITIRRKLGDRVSLSGGSTVGVGTNRSYQLNMDFIIDQNISISGVLNNYGVNNGVSTGQDTQSSTQTTQSSYGLDLKFQKRFK